MKIWDYINGTCRSVCQHNGSVVSLQWHTSLSIVSTAALDNIIRVWDARSGTILSESMIMLPILSSNNDDNIVNIDNSTDAIVSVSVDKTVKIFYFNSNI